MDQGDYRVGNQSEDPNGDDGGDDAIRSEVPLGNQDEAADPALGRDDFGHDQVGPRPTHGDAQRIHDFGKGGGEKDLVEDLPARGPKRVGDVQHLVRDPVGDVHDHERQLEEDSDPDDDELLVFIQPDEQDEQRDEG